MFNVYNKVWIMESNEPKEKVVFAVVESMDYSKRGTEKHYQLVNHQCGAGWGNNEGVRRNEDDMFKTKEALLRSLL